MIKLTRAVWRFLTDKMSYLVTIVKEYLTVLTAQTRANPKHYGRRLWLVVVELLVILGLAFFTWLLVPGSFWLILVLAGGTKLFGLGYLNGLLLACLLWLLLVAVFYVKRVRPGFYVMLMTK